MLKRNSSFPSHTIKWKHPYTIWLTPKWQSMATRLNLLFFLIKINLYSNNCKSPQSFFIFLFKSKYELHCSLAKFGTMVYTQAKINISGITEVYYHGIAKAWTWIHALATPAFVEGICPIFLTFFLLSCLSSLPLEPCHFLSRAECCLSTPTDF